MPDTLTIIDNRTGQQYELPIEYGTYADYGAFIRGPNGLPMVLAGFKADGTPIYGVTTGFGALDGRAVSPERNRALQHNLLRSHAAMAAGISALSSAIQMGLLGALLVFAPNPLYVPHLGTTMGFGLLPLEDQQLAGLIMWVPSALPYLVGGVVLVAAWLARSERQSAGGERRQG